jgi:ABC transporter DrrB family efflux protein
MFVLLFNYVFGGSIHAGTGSYIDFLLPGVMVQSILFGAMGTAENLAEDMSQGIIDRLRSLPMARSAFLGGRILADVVHNILIVLILLGLGIPMGFRLTGGPLYAIAGLVLVVVSGIPFSWLSALIGSTIKDPETAQVAGFVWVFPLTFVSSIFVSVNNMPNWLQVIAKANPVSPIADTLRAFFTGGQLEPMLWQSLSYIVGLSLLFATLAIIQYRRVK